MPQGPSHTYQCQSKGCPNGYQSAFEGAPPEWFKKKGFNTPVRCPDCRKWMKSQTDESYHCSGCNQLMRVSAKWKIRHHIAEGPYAHEKCTRCQRGQKIGRLALEKAEPLPIKRAKERGFGKLPILRNPRSYRLDIESANYERPIPGGRQTRRQHIEQHTAWSPYSLVGEGGKSPTMLISNDNTLGGLLQSAAVIANSTNPAQIREYVDSKSGHVVKVAFAGGVVEVTIINPNEGVNGYDGHELVTSYDSIKFGAVSRKLKSGEWY